MSQYEPIPRPEKPAWPGPYKGGITQSLINRFLQCPFRFYLYAVLGLKEAEPIDERLMWGDTLHVGLEHLIKGETMDTCLAIMRKYLYDNYPTAPSSFEFSTANMLTIYPTKKIENWGPIDTEVDIKVKHTFEQLEIIPARHVQAAQFAIDPGRDYSNPQDLLHLRLAEVLLRGKADMVSQDKRHLGDHKGKGRSAPSPESTRKEIGQDLQMNLYAHALGGIQSWLYDIIKIPEDQYGLPPKRASETSKEWVDRLFFTHKDTLRGYPISKVKQMWFNQTPHWQPVEDIESYMQYTVNPIILRIIDWWETVNNPNFDPNNPQMYSAIFYRSPVRLFDPAKTFKYECDYHKYLTGQHDLEHLVPVNHYYPELEEDEKEDN